MSQATDNILPFVTSEAFLAVLESMDEVTLARFQSQELASTTWMRFDANSYATHVLETPERERYEEYFEPLQRASKECVSIALTRPEAKSPVSVAIFRCLAIPERNELLYAFVALQDPLGPIPIAIVRDEASGNLLLHHHARYLTLRRYCSGCGTGPSWELRKCGRCRRLRYCSTECQRKHFSDHKEWCRAHARPSRAQDSDI